MHSGEVGSFFKMIHTLYFFLLVSNTVAAGQNPEGALVGTITDTGGARIAGATVTAEEPGASLKRSTASNLSGEFRLESLPPGAYRVTVTEPNFAPFTSDLRIAVGAAPTLSVTLTPGPIKETASRSRH